MSALSAWRVEWLRLIRTRRLLALAVVFVFFGLTEPLLARYLGDILKSTASNGGQHITIIVPPATPTIATPGKRARRVKIINDYARSPRPYVFGPHSPLGRLFGGMKPETRTSLPCHDASERREFRRWQRRSNGPPPRPQCRGSA